jgi:hypothetical protein
MVGFCHPALLNHSLPLHRDMFAVVKNWVDTLPSDKKRVILDGLTKEGVRDGRHHDDERRKVEEKAGGHGHSHGPPSQARAPPVNFGGTRIVQQSWGSENTGYGQQSYKTSSYVQNDNTYVQREETYTSTYQPREDYSHKEKHDKHRQRSNDSDERVESYSPPFHRSEEEHRRASYERQQAYGQREQSYGANPYGQSNQPSYGERETTYTSSRETEEPSYGSRNDSYNTASYERDEQRSSGYGNNRSYEDTVESFQDLNVRDVSPSKSH